MGDPHGSSFADCVHEVIWLNEQHVPLHEVEAQIDAMALDLEQRSALWLLAWSLRTAPNARRGDDAMTDVMTYA